MSVLGGGPFTAKVERLVKATATTATSGYVEKLLAKPLDEIIGFEPREWQAHLIAQERRFNSEVIHRRAGKTYLKARKLLHHAIYCPFENGRYAYVGPTYQQTEDMAWEAALLPFLYRLYDYLGIDPSKWIRRDKLTAWVPTLIGDRARLKLYGVDNPKQRLRGIYLDGVVLDEFPWHPESAWGDQIRPMLSDPNREGVDALGRANQWADFIFTPWGRDHGYEMFQRAQRWHAGLPVDIEDPDTGERVPELRDDWTAALFTAKDTGVYTEAQLRNIRVDMNDPARFEREYLCSFDAAVKGAIYPRELRWLQERKQITRVPYRPEWPVGTAWDLGWDDATAIWFFQVNPAGEIYVIDYYESSGAGLDHYADVLEQKGYRYDQRAQLFPHDVEVGELGTGKTRASVLRQLGIRPKTVAQHKVEDGIAAVRASFARLWFDSDRCRAGLDRLALYRRDYDERNRILRQQPKHDWASHAADALRYLIMGLRASGLNTTTAPGHGQDRTEF